MVTYKDFAVELANRAGEIAENYFRQGVKRDWKADDSPITIADKEINKLVLEEIRKTFPEHSIVAEEGSDEKKSEYVWVCDPIDGTAPFSVGIPTFAFSLALTKNGESILGVINDPILKKMVVAEKGKGAFLNEIGIKVSNTKKIKYSFLNLDTDIKLTKVRQPLIDEWAYTLSLYSGVYASMLVATGQLDAEIFEYTKPWDGAAVKVIVEEAGGKVTDINGNNQRYDKEINGFLATNGHLHKKLLEVIKKSNEF